MPLRHLQLELGWWRWWWRMGHCTRALGAAVPCPLSTGLPTSLAHVPVLHRTPTRTPTLRVHHTRPAPVTTTCAQNTGTSLLEAFPAEHIRTHLEALRVAAAQQRNTQPPPPNPADAC